MHGMMKMLKILPMANPFEELFRVDKDSWDGIMVRLCSKDECFCVINSLTGSSEIHGDIILDIICLKNFAYLLFLHLN
jgi:hypothetical protein